MNGSINVTHHPEHNFTIYRGNSSTGKTALLAGRAILDTNELEMKKLRLELLELTQDDKHP
jgi:hypothetical protein